MILRRVARPLLASIFVTGGINALRNAQGHAQTAKPVIDKTVGAQADALPDSVPTDPETLVKVDAAVKIGAGTALALGKMPRAASLLLLTSLVPTTAAGHRFWEYSDAAEKQQQTIHFLKNLGLAGGLLLAAADTEGKPSVGWRARRAATLVSHDLSDAVDTVRDATHEMQERATERSAKLRKEAAKAQKSAQKSARKKAKKAPAKAQKRAAKGSGSKAVEKVTEAGEKAWGSARSALSV